MKRYLTAFLTLLLLLLSGCGERLPQPETAVTTPVQLLPLPSVPMPEPPPTLEPLPEPTPVAPPSPDPSVPTDEELVIVTDYLSDICVELKYATEDNFTGQIIYDFSEARLRYGTVKKLAAAQETLAQQGCRLKIWDAYRPVSAQFVLWEVCPDPIYVADPNTSNSSHSRGNTVDVTLVALDGEELPMPTGFDDFSALADRDYSDVPTEAAANALFLENAMSAAGFSGYAGEWWHFSDSISYPVMEE